MDLKVIQPSDVLRTAGAAFLLTRKSRWVKALGLLWLGSEIYSLSLREKPQPKPYLASDYKKVSGLLGYSA